MKWNITIILAAVFLVMGQLGVEEGFGPNRNFVIYRNPFIPSLSQNSACGPMLVLITNPSNGSSYFFPVITDNVTLTIDGIQGVNPVCEYQAGGAWNTFHYGCGNGVNSTWDSVTFPEGYPINLVVRVTDGICQTTNTSVLMVHYRHGLGGIAKSLPMMLMAGVIVVLLALGWVRRRRNGLLGQ
jgi:hypothetical protein